MKKMAKRRPASEAKKTPPPPIRTSVIQQGWARLKGSGKAIASVVGVATLAFTYFNSLPAIAYMSKLMSPIRPNQYLFVHHVMKNYGSTVARDCEPEYQFEFVHSGNRPGPDFTREVDAFGTRKTITRFDLAPGQEMPGFAGRNPVFVDQSRYEEFVSGKVRLFFFSKITYKDRLSISRTKYDCRQYLPGQLELFLCSPQDWIAP
jgi:hypothetical protein